MKFRIRHTALLPLLLIAVILIDQVRSEEDGTVQVVKKVKKKTKKVIKLKPKALAKKPRERPQADAPPAYPEYDNYDSYDYGDGERDYDGENGKVMGMGKVKRQHLCIATA